jgi:hypothetical protein
MTKGQLTVRPGRVLLTVHAPIDTASIAREAVRDLAERVREVVAAAETGVRS